MSLDPLELATRRLRDSVSDEGDVGAMPPARDEAIARIAEALRQRARARRARRIYGALAAAATIALLLGGAALLTRSGMRSPQQARDLARMSDPQGVSARREGRPEALTQGARISEGTELATTASSEARLDFDNGSRVTLGGSARVRVVEQSQRKRFALEAGTFTAQVAKLGANERFVVATPDSEIEVRGTVFHVSIVPPDASCGGGTPTRLVVDEGVVVVRHAGANEVRVAAGERWPTCASPSPPTSASSTMAASMQVAAATSEMPASATTVRASGAPHASAHGAPSPEASSRLAEQNDLFEEAMRAKRSGDLTGALVKLDRLRATYPSGPLVENAEVERMRILASTDRTRGAQAAREYLKRRPHGFARAEAEALAAAAP